MLLNVPCFSHQSADSISSPLLCSSNIQSPAVNHMQCRDLLIITYVLNRLFPWIIVLFYAKRSKKWGVFERIKQSILFMTIITYVYYWPSETCRDHLRVPQNNSTFSCTCTQRWQNGMQDGLIYGFLRCLNIEIKESIYTSSGLSITAKPAATPPSFTVCAFVRSK